MVCTPVAPQYGTCIILFLALVLTSYSALASASRGKIGVDYGLNGDNLLTPEQTVELLCSRGITRVRSYEARPNVTRAFANSGIDLMIGVPDEEVPTLAANSREAFKWVKRYVIPFPRSGISAILVGNEWLSNPSNDPSLLVPAMQNIYNALSTLQFFYIYLSDIKVSTSHSLKVINNSFPPSTATFAEPFVAVMRPLIDFLDKTDSFFMVNIFPYFAYLADEKVSLEFALFESTQPVIDPNTGLNYTNLFDMQLDAVYAAITSLSSSPPSSSSSPCARNSSEVDKASNEHPHVEAGNRNRNSPKPKVVVGESGWSSGKGGSDTPPGGGHKHFLPSRHSISASSTPMSSLFSNADAHHNHLNHHSSMQNTTLSRSATLSSKKSTSTLPSYFTSPLSASSSSHNHLMHAYVASTSSSKVISGMTSSLSNMTSRLPSSPSTLSSMTPLPSSSMTPSIVHTSNSSLTNEHFSSSSPSSSANISRIEEERFSTRAPYAAKAQEDARCECDAATVENARTYNQNLIRHVLRAKGTPANPKTPIQAYVFALFNENLKPEGTEQHFGLFFPNGTAVYPINFHDRSK